MPSTASTTWQDYVEGKLITAIGTGTTTGVTVKIKQVNGSTPTWPTAAHRIKIVQKTATNNKVEKIGVASGTTQSGQTVTLGTLTRALPLDDGTDFTGSGTAQSFVAGANVFITWDSHDAAQTPKLDITNTFTGSGAIRSSSTTTPLVRLNSVTTAQRTGMSASNGDMVYDSDLGQFYKYEGGAWAAVATGSFSDAANGTAGKVDLATAAEVAAGTATDATSGASNVIPVAIVKTSSTGAANGTVPALNASVALDRSIGGLGTVSGTAYTLIANGTTDTGATQSLASVGTANQVLTSNGASNLPTFEDISYFDKTVFASGTSSATGGASSTAVFTIDTHQYTIPANDLVSGVCYEWRMVGALVVVNTGANTLTMNLALGGTNFATVVIPINTNQEFVLNGTFWGTTTAGAAASVRSSIALQAGSTITRTDYAAANVATNGTLLMTLEGQFAESDGSNALTVHASNIRKSSSTAF